MFKKARLLVPVLFSLMAIIWPAENLPLRVKAVSDRPSLIFAENEPATIRASVQGGHGPVVLEYRASETCGTWNGKGSITIPRTGAEAAAASIPLQFPGRGHFKIHLKAKCGGVEAKESTSAAIVYQPSPTSYDSPWGIMYFSGGSLPAEMKERETSLIAENMRILGASWVRLNFWLHMYSVKVEGHEVILDLSKAKRQIAAFRRIGIHIFGEIVQVPRVLSSKPDVSESRNDNGPLFSRVKPADYALWDQMVEKITRELKEDITLWEVWNEIDIAGAYWAGTTAEFLELLEHTTGAIRRGNPNAKIAAPGFSTFNSRVTHFFDAGFGKNLDFLSVHYTDRDRAGKDKLAEFASTAKSHGLDLPIINSEEQSIIPLHNLSQGVRSFKFIHLTDKYPTYIPLLRENWEVTPAAVSYSVGAHLIGSRKFNRSREFPGFKAYFFGKDGEIAAIEKTDATRDGSTPKLLDHHRSIKVSCLPREGKRIAVIDNLGRERPFPGDGVEIPFHTSFMQSDDRFASPCVFLRDCQEILSIVGVPGKVRDAIVIEAEEGDLDEAISPAVKKDFSGGKILNIFKKEAPGPKGYGGEYAFAALKEADYRVFFSGNRLERLPDSISPFDWSFDNGAVFHANTKIESIMDEIPGAPEGLSELGTVHLTEGKHTFRLRLTAPRKLYDSNWALWFDAIALVPVGGKDE